MVRDGFPRSDVVGFRRIDVLNDVIEKPPFPHHLALHVHLDNGVHLSFTVGSLFGVGTSGDRLVVGDGFVRNVERGRGIQRLVEDAHPIVVRCIALALFGVFPHGFAVPIHFLESLEAARIVFCGIEDVAIVEQVWIGPDRPSVDHASLHIEQIGAAADAKERVAVECLLLVREEQFGGPLQAFITERGNGAQKKCGNEGFHGVMREFQRTSNRTGRLRGRPVCKVLSETAENQTCLAEKFHKQAR